MATTLLSLMQDVVDELGLPQPAAIVTSTDTTVRRLLAMSNREGRDLVREHDWTVLQILHTFTTVASQEEYSLPSDYSRLIRDTEWDRAQMRSIRLRQGEVSPVRMRRREGVLLRQR